MIISAFLPILSGYLSNIMLSCSPLSFLLLFVALDLCYFWMRELLFAIKRNYLQFAFVYLLSSFLSVWERCLGSVSLFMSFILLTKNIAIWDSPVAMMKPNTWMLLLLHDVSAIADSERLPEQHTFFKLIIFMHGLLEIFHLQWYIKQAVDLFLLAAIFSLFILFPPISVLCLLPSRVLSSINSS